MKKWHELPVCDYEERFSVSIYPAFLTSHLLRLGKARGIKFFRSELGGAPTYSGIEVDSKWKVLRLRAIRNFVTKFVRNAG